MPNVTLDFELPREREAAEDAVNGHHWHAVAVRFLTWIMSHPSSELIAVEDIEKALRHEIKTEGLNL